MPTPWLVTSPPIPTKPNVASTVNTAKRCSHGFSKEEVTPENENRCGLSRPQRFPQNDFDYFASSVKSAFAPSAVTSISFSTPASAALRCSATTVYLPGGTSLMVKLPSLSVTAK